ncbi:MAG: TipAS antibiotic-recognition domain-containing protein [Candidatus Dormibacteraceae bacterium]
MSEHTVGEVARMSGTNRIVARAEAHREHISRWFYECSPGMQRSLGELYLFRCALRRALREDRPGFAVYVRDAIVANAERAGA